MKTFEQTFKNNQKKMQLERKEMLLREYKRQLEKEIEERIQKYLVVTVFVLILTLMFFFLHSVTTQSIKKCAEMKGADYCVRVLG